jgi:hypothetical protein
LRLERKGGRGGRGVLTAPVSRTLDAYLQARDNRVAPEVCQSVSGRVRGSPKRVMTLALKLVMEVMWSPAVVMTRRQ